MKYGEYLAELVIYFKNKRSNIDGKIADRTIKYCFKCKRCWQLVLSGWREAKNIMPSYYYDFPSYGKEKKLCKECKLSLIHI